MTRAPYRIARQEHLGDALDVLARHGLLTWRFDYDFARRRALWVVQQGENPEQILDTATAERIVQRHMDNLGVRWKPVPHPGNEELRQQVLRELREG